MSTSTLQDVARIAGVSIATVSRSLSNPMSVHPDTRARVMQAIDQAQYIPNAMARALATRRSNFLGLIVPDITNPFFSYVARGCEDRCRSHNYGLSLSSAAPDEWSDGGVYRLLSEYQVDGLILVSPVVAENDLPRFIQNIPKVYVDHDASNITADCIAVDNGAGARLAAEHLLAHGHRRMALVLGFPSTHAGMARLEGFRNVVAESGIEITEDYIIRAGFDPAEGARAASSLMALQPPPTAIFATNDMLAFGILRGLQTLGYSVPADVSLVGFSDLPFSEFVTPSLTSVAVDMYGLGTRAVDLLLSRIEDVGQDRQHVILPVGLSVRESSGPCCEP
jgi:DNA-binding LacI/PurR family transcriptional regulator